MLIRQIYCIVLQKILFLKWMNIAGQSTQVLLWLARVWFSHEGHEDHEEKN